MPIYAYRCTTCGHAQDVLQKMSDPLLTRCPACGAETYAKQLTAAGFQLKGSGWYVTDFRDGGGKKEAKKDGESAVAEGAAVAGDKPSDKPADKAASADSKSADGKPADGKAADKSAAAAAPSAKAATPSAAPAPTKASPPPSSSSGS